MPNYPNGDMKVEAAIKTDYDVLLGSGGIGAPEP